MRVLISGAGPAGLAVSYWLKRYGFTPTIVETAPTLRTGGYKIDVRGAAVEVLRRMEIYEKVVAANTDMQGAVLVDKNGKTIRKMTGDAFGHRVNDDQEIMRGTLCQILKSVVPDVEMIFGDSIESMMEINEEIHVNFKHNSPRIFDLVIGADGLHSNVRRLIFGEEKHLINEFGIYLCVFTVPNYLHLDRIEMQYTELGRAAAIWSTRGDINLTATFAFVSPVPIDRTREKQQQLVKSVFAGIGWEVPKLLEMMPSSNDFYFDVAAQVRMDQWAKGRVVLLGDAAYCASPMSGQGTSLALVGAYVLAGELARAREHQVAFKNYEQEMRPFIQLNQELGTQAAKLFKSQERSNLFTFIIEKLMHLAPGRLIEFFINQSTKRIHRAANSIILNNYSSSELQNSNRATHD